MTSDPRIAYGARCVWWDSIDKVSANPSGLPCCPNCGGVLMELPNQDEWDKKVSDYAERSGDEDYPALITWLRGRCFPTIRAARSAYQESEG